MKLTETAETHSCLFHKRKKIVRCGKFNNVHTTNIIPPQKNNINQQRSKTNSFYVG